jgi:SsrA-binding protein
MKTGGDLNQYTFAPNVPATVAPFRAWRDLQLVVAKGPKQVTIARARVYSERWCSFKRIIQSGEYQLRSGPNDRVREWTKVLLVNSEYKTENTLRCEPVRITLMAKKNSKSNENTIATNRIARHDYTIEDQIEVGMVLEGWEVKALRNKNLQLKESYVMVKKGEMWIIGAHISPLNTASTHVKPNATRMRKLLAHRIELDRIAGMVDRKGYTLVALSAYWSHGRAKLKIGIAKGKKAHDKRASEKDRDWKRDKARILKAS